MSSAHCCDGMYIRTPPLSSPPTSVLACSPCIFISTHFFLPHPYLTPSHSPLKPHPHPSPSTYLHPPFSPSPLTTLPHTHLTFTPHLHPPHPPHPHPSPSLLPHPTRWRGEGVDEVGYDEKSGKDRVFVNEKYYRPTEVVSPSGHCTHLALCINCTYSLTYMPGGTAQAAQAMA